jgi:hypothetical protein
LYIYTNSLIEQNWAAQHSAILPVRNSNKRKQFDNSISRTVKLSRIERIRPFQQPFELNHFDLNRLNESLELISGNQAAIDGACSLLKCFYSVLKINEIYIEILNHLSPIQYFVTKISNITNTTTLKYVRAECGKDDDKDKLLCARTQGSSFKSLMKSLSGNNFNPDGSPILPEFGDINNLTILVRKCIISRTAWGFPSLIELHSDCENDEDFLTAHTTWKDQQRKLNPRTEPSFLMLRVYGQMSIKATQVDRVLISLSRKANSLATFIHVYISRQEKPTFKSVIDLIVLWKISYFVSGGLLPRMITGDLFEIGLCQPPTINHLANKILHAGSEGPRGGLKIAYVQLPTARAEYPQDFRELTLILDNVFNAMKENWSDLWGNVSGH